MKHSNAHKHRQDCTKVDSFVFWSGSIVYVDTCRCGAWRIRHVRVDPGKPQTVKKMDWKTEGDKRR